MTNNLKPFNLEEALKNPDRVMTRSGQKVSEIHYFKTSKETYPVCFIVNGEEHGCTIEGKYKIHCGETDYDLFLLPEEKKVWINVYTSEIYPSGFSSGGAYLSESEAFDSRDDSPERNYITTIEATIPV